MTDSPGDKIIQEQPSKALNVREAMNQQFNMTTVRTYLFMYCNCYITACVRTGGDYKEKVGICIVVICKG